MSSCTPSSAGSRAQPDAPTRALTIVAHMALPLTQQLHASPPLVHAGGAAYFGLSWDALAWLEANLAPEMTTIETGAGASSIVFAASGARHTTISPSADEHRRIEAYCADHDVSPSNVTFIAGSSHEVLGNGWQGEPLDVALIDGAHGFPYPTLDWVLLAPHLKVGGHVLVDDAHLDSVYPLVEFLGRSASWDLVEVLGLRTPCFRKLDDREAPFGLEHVSSRPALGYLPIVRRPRAWLQLSLIDRTPLRRAVHALMARRAG